MTLVTVIENDNSDFDQVLKRVSILADQSTGRELSELEIPDASKMLGEEEYAKLKQVYEESLPATCLELQNLHKALLKNPKDEQAFNDVRGLTHSTKGSAHSFGYQLITSIATQANDRLKQIDIPNGEDIRILGHQIAAISLISDKKICGTEGQAGTMLLQGLKDHT